MVIIRAYGYIFHVPTTITYRNKRYRVISSSYSQFRDVALGWANTRRQRAGRSTIVKKVTSNRKVRGGTGARKAIYILYQKDDWPSRRKK